MRCTWQAICRQAPNHRSRIVSHKRSEASIFGGIPSSWLHGTSPQTKMGLKGDCSNFTSPNKGRISEHLGASCAGPRRRDVRSAASAGEARQRFEEVLLGRSRVTCALNRRRKAAPGTRFKQGGRGGSTDGFSEISIYSFSFPAKKTELGPPSLKVGVFEIFAPLLSLEG